MCNEMSKNDWKRIITGMNDRARPNGLKKTIIIKARHVSYVVRYYCFHSVYWWFYTIYRSIKVYFAVKSGYVQMEIQVKKGVWRVAKPNDEDPWYVAAKFNSDYHIPISVLKNWEEEEDAQHRLEKLAIRLAGGAIEAKEASSLYVKSHVIEMELKL